MSSVPMDPRRALTPKWTRDQVELLKRTVAKGTTDDEFKLFLYTCKRTGLDPFVKQIYAIKRYDPSANDGAGGFSLGIQIGIDGGRLIASRTGELAGIDAPIFEVDPNESWHPTSATVTVYRMMNEERIPYTHTCRWTEYVQKKKDGTPVKMWSQSGMPFNQLGKCAEMGALRKGFPNDLSGLTTQDESPVIDISAADGVTGATAEQQQPVADTKADALYSGQLIAHQPKDPQRKTPHRLTFRLDAGGDMQLSTFEMPAAFKDTAKMLGKRVQFSYDEKPNPKGGEPFRNLKHLALEVVEAVEDAPKEKQAVVPEPTPEAPLPPPPTTQGEPAELTEARTALRNAGNLTECNAIYKGCPEALKQDLYATYKEQLQRLEKGK